MKTRKQFAPKIPLLGFVAIFTLLLSGSCTQKILFLNSSVVPAAQGKVTVKNDKNKNYVIEMQITNLADVSRLQPPNNSYVVWLESDRGYAKNIGRIITTNNLNASFTTVSSFRPNKIFITAEDEENVQYPGSVVVLTTGRF